MMVIPRGKDCSVSHTICVVDDLIFDSTLPRAMKLKKKSLDWVCGEGGFEDVYLAYYFHQGYNGVTCLGREVELHF